MKSLPSAKMYKTQSGFIFSFGYHPTRKEISSNEVFWNDPHTGVWEPAASNQAGNIFFAHDVVPDFLADYGDVLVAYKAGLCIELTKIGHPYIWGAKVLKAEG